MRLVSLIIPAYNEAKRIQTTIVEAVDYFRSRQVSCEIVVAADGTDGTREVARDLAITQAAPGVAIHVLGSERRGGKGLGIRQAVKLATGEIIGFTDADNKTPITEFDKVERLLGEGSDIVIGSRGLSDSRIERRQPLYRRVGSRGFGFFMHACVGLNDIVDTQCGFKFFRKDVARDLFAQQQIDGYMFDVEILFIARQRGYRIAQVPVRWRDDGDSRLQLLSGNVRNVLDIVSIRWRHRALDHIPQSRAQMTSSSDG